MDAEIFGLAPDQEGKSLPSEFGPWLRNGTGEAVYVDTDETGTKGVETNSVIRAVRRDGFYLAKIGRTDGMSLSTQQHYVIKDSEAAGKRRARPSVGFKKQYS